MIRITPLLLACFALGACSKSEPPSSPDEHAGHMDMPAAEAVQGHSLYQLESQWTDQHDQTRQLADFAGKPVVLAMVYTHCEHACPRIVADMRLIRQRSPVKDMHFVLVSIDPARDTPGRLRHFGEETGLTAQGWSLLRGNDADVRELAAVLGVQYRRISDTDFAHSNMIHVLDRDGVIAYQQQGLGAAPDATVAAIGKLAAP